MYGLSLCVIKISSISSYELRQFLFDKLYIWEVQIQRDLVFQRLSPPTNLSGYILHEIKGERNLTTPGKEDL